jgi:hypothetical protein
MNLDHPAVRRALALFGQPDRHEAVANLVEQWDALTAWFAAMAPGDAAAREVLYQARDILATLHMELGTVHGWTRAQRLLLYQHSVRLLGAEQRVTGPPSWQEDR